MREGGFARSAERAGSAGKRATGTFSNTPPFESPFTNTHTKQKPRPLGRVFLLGGGRWIRTTEGIASRFTVCPLWPLGNSPIFFFALGGAGGRTRTPDLLITNQLLYRLSYTSIFTGQMIIANPRAFVNRNFSLCDIFFRSFKWLRNEIALCVILC